MFKLKIDVDDSGVRVQTIGDPEQLYGAIGTATVEVLKDVIPEMQQNKSPKRVFDRFCDVMNLLLHAHFGAQYEVRPTVEKKPQGEPEEVLAMMNNLGAAGLKKLAELQVRQLLEKIPSENPKE